jgi:hypothetical protein
LKADSRRHLKKQVSKFTTFFPEPDPSGFSWARRAGVVAAGNEIIGMSDGERLLVVDHQNFIELFMTSSGPDSKGTAVEAMAQVIDAQTSLR